MSVSGAAWQNESAEPATAMRDEEPATGLVDGNSLCFRERY